MAKASQTNPFFEQELCFFICFCRGAAARSGNPFRAPQKTTITAKNTRDIDPRICLDDCIFVSKKCCDMISRTPRVRKKNNFGRSNLGNSSAAATGKQKHHKPTFFPNGSYVFRLQSAAATGKQKHHKPTLLPNGSSVFRIQSTAAAGQ